MDRLVAIAVNRRYLMVGLFVVVLIGGLIAFKQLNIEAYPDPTPPMVDVVTQSPGLSAEEIERYITIPIETQVAGIKNLNTIRTVSLYGLSDVKLQFSFDYTYDEALQQVLNRLSQLAPLPGNVQPGISPTSAIGVPKQALIYEGDQVRLWVAHEDKTIELRQIKAGLANGDLVEVIGNLKPRELIVTKGALFIDRAASGS